MQLAGEAREEAGRLEALIMGSIAPLEDCYWPVCETPPEIAIAEHRALASSLVATGVDLLMVESMPTATEAKIALRAVETGLPTTVGFVRARPAPNEQVRPLSGKTLSDAVSRVSPLSPAAIFINCAAPAVITAALRNLSTMTVFPTGGYAKAGHVDEGVGWAADNSLSADRYARDAREWTTLGSRIVGGCCGTHPGHTQALRRMVDVLPLN